MGHGITMGHGGHGILSSTSWKITAPSLWNGERLRKGLSWASQVSQTVASFFASWNQTGLARKNWFRDISSMCFSSRSRFQKMLWWVPFIEFTQLKCVVTKCQTPNRKTNVDGFLADLRGTAMLPTSVGAGAMSCDVNGTHRKIVMKPGVSMRVKRTSSWFVQFPKSKVS